MIYVKKDNKLSEYPDNKFSALQLDEQMAKIQGKEFGQIIKEQSLSPDEKLTLKLITKEEHEKIKSDEVEQKKKAEEETKIQAKIREMAMRELKLSEE